MLEPKIEDRLSIGDLLDQSENKIVTKWLHSRAYKTNNEQEIAAEIQERVGRNQFVREAASITELFGSDNGTSTRSDDSPISEI